MGPIKLLGFSFRTLKSRARWRFFQEHHSWFHVNQLKVNSTANCNAWMKSRQFGCSQVLLLHRDPIHHIHGLYGKGINCGSRLFVLRFLPDILCFFRQFCLRPCMNFFCLFILRMGVMRRFFLTTRLGRGILRGAEVLILSSSTLLDIWCTCSLLSSFSNLYDLNTFVFGLILFDLSRHTRPPELGCTPSFEIFVAIFSFITWYRHWARISSKTSAGGIFCSAGVTFGCFSCTSTKYGFS